MAQRHDKRNIQLLKQIIIKEYSLKNVRIYVLLAAILACVVILVCNGCSYMWQYDYVAANRTIGMLDRLIKETYQYRDTMCKYCLGIRS